MNVPALTCSGEVVVGGVPGSRRSQFRREWDMRSIRPARPSVHRAGRPRARPRLAVVALDILEQGDVVVGAEYLIEEAAQRARFLRKMHQEIVL